jgi:hypothetical protein
MALLRIPRATVLLPNTTVGTNASCFQLLEESFLIYVGCNLVKRQIDAHHNQQFLAPTFVEMK